MARWLEIGRRLDRWEVKWKRYNDMARWSEI